MVSPKPGFDEGLRRRLSLTSMEKTIDDQGRPTMLKRHRLESSVLLSAIVLLWLPAIASAQVAATPLAVPVPVSPGSADALTTSGSPNPSFSWAGVDQATRYELVVFDLSQLGSDAEPVVAVVLPGAATSWTPPLESSLAAGGSYAWMVRAVFDQRDQQLGEAVAPAYGPWSVAHQFRVTSQLPLDQVRTALRDLEKSVSSMKPPAASDAVGRSPAQLPATAEVRPKRPVDHLIRRSSSLAAPAATGLRADAGATTGVAYGVHGTSASTAAGSIGVAGEAIGASGDVVGVRGRTQSSDGSAGSFENVAGGDILRGLSNGVEVFSVLGNGNVIASSFHGDGSNLTNLIQQAGPFNVSRHNSAGTTGVDTGVPTTAGLCFLTEVTFEDIDSYAERATCEIVSSSGTWHLRAGLGGAPDADAWCEARCLRWQ